MPKTAMRADPGLWETVKAEVTRGRKGGRAGQWSARKAQLAVHEYKRRGGTYVGPKTADNSLTRWIEEGWGTRSGRRSLDSGERYLPKRARQALTAEEYRRTTAKKRRDSAEGRQFSAQPPDVARKTAAARKSKPVGAITRDELYAEARRRGIAGRSRMVKDELAAAIARDGAR